MPSHISLVEPFGPEWPSCRQIFARDDACTKSTMRFHASSVLRKIHAGAARRDAPLARNAGHLGEDEPRSAERARAEVHEVKIVRACRRRALYMSMGETTMRLRSSSSRKRNGVNIGGTGRPREPVFDAADVRACRAGADSRDRSAGCASADCRRTARAAASRSARRSRTIPSSCARRSAASAPRACALLRMRERGPSRETRSASPGAMASSIASFVPEPTEKWAVWAASPSSTTFSCTQRSLLTRVKFSQSRPAQVRAVRHEAMAAADTARRGLRRMRASARYRPSRGRARATSLRGTRR